MTILNVQVGNVGQSGVSPTFIYIDTNNTVDQVMEAGFLNGIIRDGIPLSESQKALVTTRTSPNSKSIQTNLFDVTYSGGNWSLALDNSILPLQNSYIFIGGSDGLAHEEKIHGDATITNEGALAISSEAITLSKLAPPVAPAAIVKFMGQLTTVGGSASEAFTLAGAMATDRAFVQMVNFGSNNVAIVDAVVTNNTLTVTFNGDPGADTVFNYQLLRATS